MIEYIKKAKSSLLDAEDDAYSLLAQQYDGYFLGHLYWIGPILLIGWALHEAYLRSKITPQSTINLKPIVYVVVKNIEVVQQPLDETSKVSYVQLVEYYTYPLDLKLIISLLVIGTVTNVILDLASLEVPPPAPANLPEDDFIEII